MQGPVLSPNLPKPQTRPSLPSESVPENEETLFCMACSLQMHLLMHLVLTGFSSARHGQIQKLCRGQGGSVAGPTRELLLGRCVTFAVHR